MPFYIRKALKLGPVRFNLSKSGVGLSGGVKGFRVGVRPNGISYLHAGRYGLYYRKELHGIKGSSDPKHNPSGNNTIQPSSKTTQYKTAPSQNLTSQSRKKLLTNLNKSYKSIKLNYLCAVLFLIFSLVGFQVNNSFGLAILFLGLIMTVFVTYLENKRRTIVITYDFEDNKGEHFKKIISAFNHLASCKKIWSLIDSRSISGTHESKHNAGAENLVNRTEAQIGAGTPPWVKTNIDVPILKTLRQTLYMMPDGILVYDDKGVGFVDYSDVQIDTNTTRFIEENPPSDARVIDTTWLHPNKNGGPDRRFRDNYEIPIVQYGEIKIQSNSGMLLYLMTSKYDSPSDFSYEFGNILK